MFFNVRVLEQLNGKQGVMAHLSHPDSSVRYEALLAVQKLMVHNWSVTTVAANIIDDMFPLLLRQLLLSAEFSLRANMTKNISMWFGNDGHLCFVCREYLGKQIEKGSDQPQAVNTRA